MSWLLVIYLATTTPFLKSQVIVFDTESDCRLTATMMNIPSNMMECRQGYLLKDGGYMFARGGSGDSIPGF